MKGKRMVELEAGDRQLALPLFETMASHLAIESVLRNLSLGSVWVDSREKPAAGLLTTQGRAYLAGWPTSDGTITAVRQILENTFYPYARAAGREGVLLFASLPWEEATTRVLAGQRAWQGQRRHYLLDATGRRWEPALPGDYRLRAVDAALLAEPDLQGLDGVVAEMRSERPSVEDFLERSFGAAIVHEGRIVAWCMSEYNSGGRCELGIWTDEAQRRKGLARATATAVIARASQEGIRTIGWHCWTDNIPSNLTAKAIGFQLAEVHTAHVIALES